MRNASGKCARSGKTGRGFALVALAPNEMVDRLALLSGLLDALGEIPANSPPVLAMLPKTLDRARRALADWRTWEQTNLKRVSA